MWTIYAHYDVTTETMMFGLCIIMLVIMMVTQPRFSMMLRMTALGFGMGGVTILFHQWVLYLSCMGEHFSKGRFSLAYVLYCICYTAMLNSIYGYISMLSYRRRSDLKPLHIMYVIGWVLFLSVMLFPLVTGRLYEIGPDGSFAFTNWQYSVNVAGVLDAIACLLVTCKNSKTISKIVTWGMLIFTPLEIVVLLLETAFHSVYFISYTYVLPFMLFYILFHCAKYDDVVGCQNADALNTQIENAIRKQQKYIILNVSFPQLQKREFDDIRGAIDYVSSERCRKIERLKTGIRLYSFSLYGYALFAVIHSEEEAQRIIDGVNEVLLEPIQYKGVHYQVYSKQTIIRENEMLKTYKHVNSFMGYLRNRFSSNMEHEQIVAGPEDYKAFESYYEVEQALLDIRIKNDLDDERVVCLIQPIHQIASDSFRTGESLMRMQIGGRMVFPDQFIPLAENNDCIHTLTKIMLNKVCRQIKKLEDEGYDFDAVTVNCSTQELQDWDMHQEVYEIIKANEIRPEHIRLEITESTSTSNYDSILHNMQKLIERGINFYLDDFGTGYSNLERIVAFPFRTIKFDKSILYNALANGKANELIRMMVKFFKSSGLQTVVEGVEDRFQYEYCKDVGFDYIQGYMFSKPRPAEEIVEFFEK